MAKKKTPKVGRPAEIKERTELCTFNLTSKQKKWIKDQMKERGFRSQSLFMRELIAYCQSVL